MNNQKWQRYLQSLRETPTRGSVAGIRRSMDTLLDTGQHTGGSPYKDEDNEKPRLKGKKNRNQVSAPPGAPGGGSIGAPGPAAGGALEEEVEPATFEKQTELNPRFWQDGELKPKISRRLEKIAREFLEGIDTPVAHKAGDGEMVALMEDLRLTGSLANYNWSKYSDVDLHIVVDFSKIDENTELVEQFFYGLIWRWNELHDITIYGHEVEIFVENVGHVTHSAGIYSITNQKWVIEPDPDKVEFDYVTARKKADAIETEVNMIEKFADQKPRAALKSVERLKQKIRRMRKAGLHSSEQEYSAENIAFKILRREDTLDKLNDIRYTSQDRILSIG